MEKVGIIGSGLMGTGIAFVAARQRVTAGRLGKKSGWGFYAYPTKEKSA